MNAAEHRNAPRFRVLVVDDDRRFVSDTILALSDGFDVGGATSTVEALAQIEALKPDVVLLDVILKDGIDGIRALERIRALDVAPEVVMLTGVRSSTTVVEAIRSGAFHYVEKGSPIGELANLINRAAMAHICARQLAAMEAQTLGQELLVFDPAMRRVIKDIKRAAPTESNVLIIGESGTGKELVAARIHALSRRGAGPFEAVNCAAIADGLMESELFGHVRGAFTTAVEEHEGCFARASGGTLFLDEIGLSPISLQTKLLRVLESREYMRVGGSKIEKSDVRVVAASSADLEAMVAAGSFKPELLYRLNVLTLVLPPLRERPQDILPMAEHFLALIGEQKGRRGLSFAPAARAYLEQHEWRGNVRELKSRIERAVVFTEGPTISVELLLPIRMRAAGPIIPWRRAGKEFKQEYFSRLMHQHENNVTKAAKSAGISREALSRILREVGLRESDRDGDEGDSRDAIDD